MKKLLLPLFLAVAGGALAQNAPLLWGDQGNGTYINPILNADFSDPDVIRVDSMYYMVASDFHFMGMQVLESQDMVNWRYVAQIYDHFDEPGWEENAHYAGGSWAPDGQVVPLNQSAMLTDKPAVWAHHNFLGWAETDDAFEPEYPYGQQNEYVPRGEKYIVTLYAVWEENAKVTVTFKATRLGAGLPYTGTEVMAAFHGQLLCGGHHLLFTLGRAWAGNHERTFVVARQIQWC